MPFETFVIEPAKEKNYQERLDGLRDRSEEIANIYNKVEERGGQIVAAHTLSVNPMERGMAAGYGLVLVALFEVKTTT